MSKDDRKVALAGPPVKTRRVRRGKVIKISPRSAKGVSDTAQAKFINVYVCRDGDLNKIPDTETDGVVDIASGRTHVAILTQSSRILTWGANDKCALGQDTVRKQKFKAEGAGDSHSDHAETKIVRLAAADNATLALADDGLVYGWGTYIRWEGKPGFGLNSMNELVEKQADPILIPRLANIIQICACTNFCLALGMDGKVYSWGRGKQSQLGRRLVVSRTESARHSTTSIETLQNKMSFVPGIVPLPKAEKIVSIHAGSDHAFAIDAKGDTWAWGLNNFGQTGIAAGAGVKSGTVAMPKRVPSLTGKTMKMIVGGNFHSIGITQSGECLVRGHPTKVILTDGKPSILLEPTPLPYSGCTYAAAGAYHSLLVTDECKVYSWGLNPRRQCGQGIDERHTMVPTLIDSESIRNRKISRVGFGAQYTLIASAHQGVELDEAPVKKLEKI
ncbi:hypothetical protein AJ78_05496 [Emergomyces pasteurianus Ep9510]|uniref:RCC1-like domain-containing protein n=1 Tax=Emergomyces pasteurianus Ep9510 TaxID=1447872 RepID=A0A1J9PDN5_9EURO|nr:hypothetical protein AJ78_05496 [Emergomyces pasteurianus Ep9510]